MRLEKAESPKIYFKISPSILEIDIETHVNFKDNAYEEKLNELESKSDIFPQKADDATLQLA